MFDTEQRRDLYFAYLSPWEAEEIVVIFKYAVTRYGQMLSDPEGAIFSISSPDNDLQGNGGWSYALFAHGPDLLCQVLAQKHLPRNPRALSDLVCGFRYESYVRLVDSTVSISSRLGTVYPAGVNSDWNLRSGLYFEGDDAADGPNAGWLVVHNTKVESR